MEIVTSHGRLQSRSSPRVVTCRLHLGQARYGQHFARCVRELATSLRAIYIQDELG